MTTPQDLVLMAVHAHPGPESTNTGGVLAHYARQGVRTVLVTCTNGEFGKGAGGVEPGEAGHDPAAVAVTRVAELKTACGHLGVNDLELLGYHDSGMPEWELRHEPDVFCNIPTDTAASRLAELIDHFRPQVMVTYDPDAPYRHPDQLHTARVTHRAIDIAGIPVRRYNVAMGTTYWRHIRNAVLRAGLPDPFPDPELSAELAHIEGRITTTIDVSEVLARKQAAVLSHAGQVGGTWIEKLYAAELPAELGKETYIRTHGATAAPAAERDLFAGIRAV
ncbi:PIG-L family deacetylase [Streptomyces sp. NPDC004647]|uniref:PIG-L family deacetylase n=1 Tax=Streptomyces sp. NPDC004647 TaxID=3154671 RepID=UPI0033B8E762